MIEMLTDPAMIATASGVLFALLGAAALITKLTPSPKDDAYVATAYRVVVKIAGLFGVKPPKK